MSEEHLISSGIARARSEGREIDDTTARVIANQWHSGMTSGLYSFVSTGAIREWLWHDELAEEYYNASPRDREALDWLGTYFVKAGIRGPQPNWNDETAF